MEEKIMNTEENMEEVPLDLFNQVAIEDEEPLEIVDLSSKTVEQSSTPVKKDVISFSKNAYLEARKKMQTYNSGSSIIE